MSEIELEDLRELVEATIEEVEDHAELVEDRLEHIPDSHVMPDPEDMDLHEAREFRLGVVFIDINDFSDYSERNNKEDVLFMLNVFIPKVMEGIREFHGAFEKNTGDGILAYFGPEDDDNEIADTILRYFFYVQMMLHMAANPILRDYNVEPISISASAALGTVHISRIGVHSMSRRTAVSSTANIASELEDIAGTDQYLVGQGVHKYASDDGFGSLFEPAGDLSGFKWGNDFLGWTAPMQYYEFRNIWKEVELDML